MTVLRPALVLAALSLAACGISSALVPPDATLGDGAVTREDALVADTVTVTSMDAADGVVADSAPSVNCTRDADCFAVGQVCDTVSRACVDCVIDTQCASAFTCHANRCIPRCASDRDCAGARCDPSTGACVACVTDTHCATGQHCGTDHTCFTPVCTPGAAHCLSDRSLATCSSDGRTETTTACGADAPCVVDHCQTPVCAVGARYCSGVGTVATCNADRTGYTDTACASGEACRNGACVRPVCIANDVVCATRTTTSACIDPYAGYTARMTCASGTVCIAGRCAPTRCVPGAHTCTAAGTVRQCDADGLGYTDTACTAGTACASGECIAQTCVPGAATCTDTRTRSVCNPDGLGTTAVTCPGETVCNAGLCSSVCQPGAARCATTTSAAVCASTGATETVTTCLARPNAQATCVSGACAIACDAGSGDCDGFASNGCEAALATSDLDCGACGHACAVDEACSAGVCGCATGTMRCGSRCVATASDVAQCGACGHVCATPSGANTVATCTAGVCGSTCASGHADCDGNATNGCEADTGSSLANCGACGHVCATTCTNGRCEVLLGGLGGTTGYGANVLPASDDAGSMPIDLTAAFANGLAVGTGTPRTSLWVNNNGIVSFDAAVTAYTPSQFETSGVIIAPFWADVDTRGGGQPVRNTVTWDVRAGQFTATWHAVGYFAQHDDLANSFQLVFRARTDVAADAWDMEFRYERCEWTTGDASDGMSGLGGTPARAGFAFNPTATMPSPSAPVFQLPNSGTAAVLQLCSGSNVGVPGVWRYAVRHGIPVP